MTKRLYLIFGVIILLMSLITACSVEGEVEEEEVESERLNLSFNDERKDFLLSAGLAHTVVLTTDGNAIAVGNNDDDQLNVADWSDLVAVSAGRHITAGLRADGTVIVAGSGHPYSYRANNWTNIVEVEAGTEHIVGLRSDGTVIGIGTTSAIGRGGDMSHVRYWTGIIALSAGENFTVGLRYDGTVICTGSRALTGHGRLESRDDWLDIIAVSAGAYHTVGLRSDGTVAVAGPSDDGGYGFLEVSDWADIIAVSAGRTHTVGLRSDGTVVAVGNNRYGQSDVDDWSDIVAVSAGGFHTLGLRSDGIIVAVGNNYFGQLGFIQYEPPISIFDEPYEPQRDFQIIFDLDGVIDIVHDLEELTLSNHDLTNSSDFINPFNLYEFNEDMLQVTLLSGYDVNHMTYMGLGAVAVQMIPYTTITYALTPRSFFDILAPRDYHDAIRMALLYARNIMNIMIPNPDIDDSTIIIEPLRASSDERMAFVMMHAEGIILEYINYVQFIFAEEVPESEYILLLSISIEFSLYAPLLSIHGLIPHDVVKALFGNLDSGHTISVLFDELGPMHIGFCFRTAILEVFDFGEIE